MKNCSVCCKEYSTMNPIETKLYTFLGENEKECFRNTNYCSVRCLYTQIVTIETYFNENQCYVASIPIDFLEMCQYCGTFFHPSEYCHQYNIQKQELENFSTVGNLIGEWTKVSGNLLYIICGKNIDLKSTIIQYEATMQKLISENIEERSPLIYFWFSQESCKELCQHLSDTEFGTINIQKQVLLDIIPIFNPNTNEDTISYCMHQATKVYEPNKIFFPYDITSENCWWPVSQEESVLEEIFHEPRNVKSSICLKDYSLDSVYIYEQEEFHPQVEQEEKNEYL